MTAAPPSPGFVTVTPVAATVTSVENIHLGRDSQFLVCPHCHHDISTRVETSTTSKTHISALLMFIFCCWPCAWLPYCMDSCKNIDHYCPNCGAYLGTYQN